MAVDTSRIMIKTFVKSALKDAEEAPERCTRNLVDMALNFADKGSQQSFFQVARQMLNNENSPYYPLIEDILKHMDKDKLLTFGLNLGYNSCTKGAKTIRQTESEEHFHIPWLLALETGDPSTKDFLSTYQSVFDQGKALGIYAYQLHVTKDPEKVLPLAAANPDCAIILFCHPSLITEEFADTASTLNNILIAVKYDDMADTACLILRDHRLLYSLYYVYTEESVSDILSGSFFRFAEEMHSPFAATGPVPSCSADIRKTVYDYVLKNRNEQVFRTIPLDLSKDAEHAARIISSPACIVGFCKSGHLHAFDKEITDDNVNLFLHPLADILKYYFPKND